MTSQRYSFARGIPGALGVFGLSFLLCASPAYAQAAATPGGAAPTGGAPAAGAPAAGAPAEVAAPAPAATGAPDATTAEAGAYTVRLKTLEKNVNELKEQIFRTKARLNLLKETVLGGVIGAARAYIKHKNEMGSSFRLVTAAYALDGVQIFS